MLDFLRKNELTLWLFIIFISLVATLIYALFSTSRDVSIETQKVHLQTLADEKAYLVETFLETQKEKLEILSTEDAFKELISDPDNQQKRDAAKIKIEELKKIIPGISVLNLNGIVIIGEIDLPGTDYSKQPYFTIGDHKITFERYYDALRKNDYYVVGGPIYDKVDKTKVIGAIGFDLELEKIGSLMKELVEGVDNEAYLIDEAGLMLSPSEFIGQNNGKGVLIQEVQSEGAKTCLADIKKFQIGDAVAEHEEAVSRYINYMGDKVYGAHAYVPSIRGCVMAEEGSEAIDHYSLLGYIKRMFIWN